MSPRHLTRLAFVIVCMASGQPAVGDVPQPNDLELLSQAGNEFARGARQAAENANSAPAAMAPALASYRELIEQRGFHSAGLYYNLANTHFLSGDAARAIVGYRRALWLDPSLADAARNLDAARARAGTLPTAGAVAGTATGLGSQTPMFSPIQWLAAISELVTPRRVLFVTVVLWILGWSAWASRLRGRNGRPLLGAASPAWVTAALLVGAALGAGSLWAHHRAAVEAPPAVLVVDRTVGRKGPDELGYEPSFTEPIRAGTEVTILETRGGWINIRLANGRTTWVPSTSLERV